LLTRNPPERRNIDHEARCSMASCPFDGVFLRLLAGDELCTGSAMYRAVFDFDRAVPCHGAVNLPVDVDKVCSRWRTLFWPQLPDEHTLTFAQWSRSEINGLAQSGCWGIP